MRASALLALLPLAACSPSSPGIDAGDAAPAEAAVVADAEGADSAPDAPAPPPLVTLAEGMVQGTRGAGFLEFQSVPYAAPPVGSLRWRAPAPVVPWTGVRDATARSPRCWQILVGAAAGSEDCLYVTVHTPDPMPRNAPVMVWIHGGAFTLGEGVQTDGGTRGDILARTQGVVVVSMNYRLGPLGFLAHPALTAEGGGHSGNYGLLDQRAALQWVRSHIAAFGGDPANVTLFGESAGGVSVCAHLVAPGSEGLFQRAIVESGPCGLRGGTLATGEMQGQRMQAALHCQAAADPLACMRAAPPSAVLSALPAPPGFVSTDPRYERWTPIEDGSFVPTDSVARVNAGTFLRVPLLFGWNADEGTLFAMLSGLTEMTAAQYPEAIRGILPGDTARGDRVLAQYPLSAYPSPWQAYSAALGDYLIACSARRTLRAMAAYTQARAYYFAYPNASFLAGSNVPLGAFHSAEVQFVFGHPGMVGSTRFTGEQLALNQSMMGYWARFARTGDPNGDGAPNWPVYTASGDMHLRLDAQPRTGTGASADACAFWEGLGVYSN